MMEILVIIPVYNEEKNIGDVIKELRNDMDYADILVVNDCSKDNTIEILKQLKVPYISLPFNLGYSGALQAGFKYAIINNYKYVIQFDGDGQHIAAEATKLYNKLIETNADIVIGSRFKENISYKHSFFRKIGTNIFKYVIKSICKVEIFDPTSGFQVLKKSVFEIYSKMNGFPDYPDANLIIEMLFKGFKIEETQVNMRERVFGISMHSGIIKPIKYMIKMFYSILFIIVKQMTSKNKYFTNSKKVGSVNQ